MVRSSVSHRFSKTQHQVKRNAGYLFTTGVIEVLRGSTISIVVVGFETVDGLVPIDACDFT